MGDESSSEKESLKDLKKRLKKCKVALVDISKVKPHEEVSEEDITCLRKTLLNDNHGVLKFPIVCDKEHNIILDGHNRYTIFKNLNLKKIPVFYVDYEDEHILVGSWRKGKRVTKKDVIHTAECGEILPHKTTKHLYKKGKKCVRILKILPRIDVPLEILEEDN